jgi:catechol 2,3-dioxygenase-like lactoylglutathione lyase family enzyme
VHPTRVHHVSINVTDLDAAVEFYVSVLGCEVREDRPDFGFAGAWLNVGATQLHLIVAEGHHGGGEHFAVEVDDLDAAVEELRAKGCTPSHPVVVGPGRQSFVTDPSGNLVELNQPG